MCPDFRREVKTHSRPTAQHQEVHPVQPEPSGAAGAVWTGRPGGRIDAYLREHERTENFPVALRILPRGPRGHLKAVYDVARVIDDLGDEAPGDRVALLDAFRGDLSTIWRPEGTGGPVTPVLRGLAPTVAECGLSERHFLDLIEANRVDQQRTTYPEYADLAAYCELSANPIGRIVLEVFGASTPETVALSDRICTALQIVEHCQDVAEDHRAGRCYLPQETLDRFGVDRSTLDAAPTPRPLRQAIAAEVDRCTVLLDEGLPLIRMLHGWARLAVGGYLAGGRAAIGALRRADFNVAPVGPKAGKGAVLSQLVAVLRGRGAAPRERRAP